jgi:hypothetical protein
LSSGLQGLDGKLDGQQDELDQIASRASQSSLDQLATQVSTLQTNLDALAARALPTSLELAVLGVSGGQTAQESRLLVLVTEHGREADGVTFTGVSAVTTAANAPTETTDLEFSASELRAGLFELAIHLPPAARNATSFMVLAEHVHVGGVGDGDTHYGSALVSAHVP